MNQRMVFQIPTDIGSEKLEEFLTFVELELDTSRMVGLAATDGEYPGQS